MFVKETIHSHITFVITLVTRIVVGSHDNMISEPTEGFKY